MKKGWFLLGVVAIGLLLLLQTRYKDYTTVVDDGYAVPAEQVERFLYADPDTKITDDRVELCKFKADGQIYSRGDSFYIGEDKAKIDLKYPMYINSGEGIRINHNEGSLYDLGFNPRETIPGMAVIGGVAYNSGGERADATTFTFYQIGDGIFINLVPFTYNDGEKDREIKADSICYFTENYMTYMEYDDGELVYQIAKNLSSDMVMGYKDEDGRGYDIAYSDMLKRLGVISDKEFGPGVPVDPQTFMEGNNIEATEDEEEDSKTSTAKPAVEDQGEPEQPEPAAAPTGVEVNQNTNTSEEAAPRTIPEGENRGVRPDSARPDKTPAQPREKDELTYVEPVVTVKNITAGVYRISTEMTVYDPTTRIDQFNKVQIEYYEVNPGDNSEKLVYRQFTTSSRGVVAGEGNIKPDTSYRVKIYYSYKDEEGVSHQVIKTDDTYVTTGSVSEVGQVALKTGSEGNVRYNHIPVYYDTYLQLVNMTCDADATDAEALYGINSKSGITVTVKSGNKTFKKDLSGSEISNFKRGTVISMDSVHTLSPNSSYTYEITAKDFFGNDIVLTNNTGSFDTCKSRPTGTIDLEHNSIGDVRLKFALSDEEESIVTNANGEKDIYLVVSAQAEDRYAMENTTLWEACQDYIDNGNKRVRADEASGRAEGQIHWLYKMKPSEYLNSSGEVEFSNFEKTIKDLDLNHRYYVYILTDYDLNNNGGVVSHGISGDLNFRTESISALGIANIVLTYNEVGHEYADITYRMNTTTTAEDLRDLVTSIKFDVVSTDGDEPAVIATTEVPTTAASGETDLDAFVERNGATHGDITSRVTGLESMTTYKVKPTVVVTYNQKEYEVDVNVNKDTFTTCKTPATVEVTNVLLAGGTLDFDVIVKDPDGSIIGNSSDYVLVNIYNSRNSFVKALRIEKNKQLNETITGLDVGMAYTLSFIAVDYNEGFTNATYVSNKKIGEYKADNPINLSGKVQLESLDDSSQAKINVDIHDGSNQLNGAPYNLRIYRDDEDVTAEYGTASTSISGYSYVSGTRDISDTRFYALQKGDYQYKFQLWVTLAGKELVLDELTFTTEAPIENISSEYAFIDAIKNNPSGKYCVTADLDFGKTSEKIYKEWKVDENGAIERDDNGARLPATDSTPSYSPNDVTSIFNGSVDFQGYTLRYVVNKNAGGIFSNIGPSGEIYNLDFQVGNEATLVNNTRGALCNVNYGNIHDIHVRYIGGDALQHNGYGLITSRNAASGTIERFVVANTPEVAENSEETKMGFTARASAGLVCYQNYGVLRNGYVYGDDIYSAVGTTSVGGNLQIGGVAGRNESTGQLYNVYSLVNIIVANPSESTTEAENARYGSVVGYAEGNVHNIYGVGISKYNAAYNNKEFNEEQVGPVIGYVNMKNQNNVNVYYYNNDSYDFVNDKAQSLTTAASLNDYSWQNMVLGSQFDTDPVAVGYYPHVNLSSELPEQEYIELPTVSAVSGLQLISANVTSVDSENNTAQVQFRFANPKNATIASVTIDDLTTTLDPQSSVSKDGYTTINGTVSNPTKYLSSYGISSVGYVQNKANQSLRFTVKPQLSVDFYREIKTPDDWYNYVVKSPLENARLGADIDFTGVAPNRIYVSSDYKGKLDGGTKPGCSYGYSLKNIDIEISSKYRFYPAVFKKVYGEVKNVVVEDMTLNSVGYPSGSYNYCGFVGINVGTVQNCHIRGADISAYGYVGSLVGYSDVSSEIIDSSCNDVKIVYKEPDNINTTAEVGALVGRANLSRVSNCYSRKGDITVEECMVSNGIGGVIGRSYYASIDGVYGTGNIDARCINLGGIIGMHEADNARNQLTNLVANVNLKGYQDSMGGIIGNLNLGSTLTERNNMTGVSFGSVYCTNTGAEGISSTIGFLENVTGKFYGSDFQLLNGTSPINPDTGEDMDENTFARITYAQAKDPATYRSAELLNMGNVYDYSVVSSGYMPKLYYEGTNKVLPFQDENISIATETYKGDLKVIQAKKNPNGDYVNLDISGPVGATVTGVTIEQLVYDPLSETVGVDARTITDSNGKTRIKMPYKSVNNQEHFLDSYFLTSVNYKTADGVEHVADFSDSPVRVDLTLYAEIRDIPTWNQYLGAANGYGNYENYKITRDIDFGTGATYATNVKVGRLVGETSNGPAKLSNISITANKENLIYRLNSEMRNITFENVEMKATGRAYFGIVGSSAAKISDMTFKDIVIQDTGSNSYVGIIAKQVGGCVGIYDPDNPDSGKIVMDNVTVGTTAYKNSYVGGLCAYATNGTVFANITADNITANGKSNVGGIAGQTGKASFNHITMDNTKVCASTNYAGGIVGYQAAGRTNNTKAAYIMDVHVKGTRDGNTSSTTITCQNEGGDNFVGAIAGRAHSYNQGEYAGKSLSTRVTDETAPTVEGVAVIGQGNYVGGAYGYTYGYSNTTVKDCYIGYTKTPTAARNYVGGVAGYSAYENFYNRAENVSVNAINHNYVGIINGYNSSSGTNYAVSKNSSLTATSNLNVELKGYGGINGYSGSYVRYCASINNRVDASSDKMQCVGGIVGYMTSEGQRNICYGTPTGQNSYSSMLYYVKGDSYVGGLNGWQNSGTTQLSYSNINVISKGNYAGGLDGYYNNRFVITNGKKSFNTCSLHDNYFAGTVQAEDYAGGAVGALGLVEYSKYAMGTRSKADTSGANDERVYTYQNMILPYSINTHGTHAYAFAGDRDGFEGKANYYNNTYFTKDRSGANTARDTMLWAETQINGKALKDYTSSDYADDIAVTLAKNTSADNTDSRGDPNSYRYILYNGGYSDGGNGHFGSYKRSNNTNYNEMNAMWNSLWNVRLVTSDQLEKGDTTNNANRLGAHSVYYSLGWANNSNTEIIGSGKQWVIFQSNTKYDKYTGVYKSNYYGKAYLPHIRQSSSGAATDDYMTILQTEEGINIPVPQNRGTYSFVTMTKNASLGSMFGAVSHKVPGKVRVYTVDGDKVNIEFSEDFLNNGFFDLSYGDEEVCKDQYIDRRVYTFTYNHGDTIKINYGYKDEWGETESELKKPTTFTVADLSHKAMVYGDKYYYITPDGVKAGANVAPSTDASSDSDKSRAASMPEVTDYMVSESVVLDGEFISLINGKAVRKDGVIYDVTTGKVMAECPAEMKLLDEAMPLMDFDMNGHRVKSYETCAYVSDGDEIVKNNQIVAGYDGTVAILDPSLEYRRNGVNVYTYQGDVYCTVAGEDGYLVDLYQGKPRIPKDMKESGIIDMTTNYDASAPYIIVTYQNGAMVGFNYLTGTYLFEVESDNAMGLGEYMRVYFTGTTSGLANVHNTYVANLGVIQGSRTPEDLLVLVSGNSSGNVITGHNKNTNTATADGKKSATETDGEATDSEGSLRDVSKQKPDGEITEGNLGEKAQERDGSVTQEESEALGETAVQDVSASKDPTVEKDASATQDASASGGGVENSDSSRRQVETDELMLAYSQEDENFQVLDVDKYLSEPEYVSENDRLGVKDLSVYSNQNAQSDERQVNTHGLLWYIIVVVAVISLLGVVYIYRRKHRIG
ncbi:MAG: hypothetical protein K6B67_09420 [Lachnospiraceae bacterium]|nr:hypothetical protein [Lachnospiraceae bacterium]